MTITLEKHCYTWGLQYRHRKGIRKERDSYRQIAIYDRKTSDTMGITYNFSRQNTVPNAGNIKHYKDRYFVEQIIALDSMDFKDGFILHSYEVDEKNCFKFQIS